VLDQVFGVKNFRNEIIWCYTRPGVAHQKQLSKVHDSIYWYSKGDNWCFKGNDIRIPYADSTISRGKYSIASSKVTKGIDKRVLPEGGKIPEDWWQIPMVQGNALERLGYPTQKPEALLERIIKMSSNEGDVVLDAFAGCGTTIAIAQRLERRWIGIDITHLAIALLKYRLQDAFGDDVEYKVIGEPVDISSARALAKQDRYQFQWWALSLVKARPVQEKKKGADEGVDGVIYFQDIDPPKKDVVRKIVVQVKSGKVSVKDIRELKTVVENQKAVIGAFITLESPTTPMVTEAISTGYYERWGKKYPKIQILTIEELLKGKEIEYPQSPIDITFKKAEKVEATPEIQTELSL
jgi:site-specific DNA-methyltransferase (adenine-specific)